MSYYTDEELDHAPQPVELDAIQRDDFVILVYGTTGVGKSTFIRSATSDRAKWVVIGNTLDSQTSSIGCTRFYLPKVQKTIVLVDMPGFDDPNRYDAEVLNILASWLLQFWRKRKLISGIIYLHRITDERYNKGASIGLNILMKMYGPENYHRLSIVTTFWDEVQRQTCADDSYPNEAAVAREKELINTVWSPLLLPEGVQVYQSYSGGIKPAPAKHSAAGYGKFDASNGKAHQTAVDIISDLVNRARRDGLEGVEFFMQRELINEYRDIDKTEAGRAISSGSTNFFLSLIKNVRVKLFKRGWVALNGALNHIRNPSPGNPAPIALDSKDVKPDDYVVWVFGFAGAGRSTFITHLSGIPNPPGINVTHGIWSGTPEVVCLKVFIPDMGRSVVLVDTPCFGMVEYSNRDILKKLMSWLHRWYANGVLLRGVIIIQSIQNNRLSPDVIPLIASICGPKALCSKCIIRVTSKWSKAKDPLTQARERHLHDMWASAEDAFRYTPSMRWLYREGQGTLADAYDEAKKILLSIPRDLEKPGIPLLVQEEMSIAGANGNRNLISTRAGRVLQYITDNEGHVK